MINISSITEKLLEEWSSLSALSLNQLLCVRRESTFRTALNCVPDSNTMPAGVNQADSALERTRRDGDTAASAATGGHNLRSHQCKSVSFFVPSSPEVAQLLHACIGNPLHGMVVKIPDVSLPAHLHFIQDQDLLLPVANAAGQTEIIQCGQHFTLTTSGPDASREDFDQVMRACQPYHAVTPLSTPLDVDLDYLPGDRMTMAAVMALDSLIADTNDPDTKLFGTLYSWHLGATDMPFTELLSFKPAAAMVATALDAWTVMDPFVWGHTFNARNLLAKELPYEFSGLKYKPYWEVRPFEFLGGVYTDELYESNVRVAAPAFTHDPDLKSQVRATALGLFAKLATMGEVCQCDSQSFKHSGVDFSVTCARAGGQAPAVA